jgi:hypothetical protein
MTLGTLMGKTSQYRNDADRGKIGVEVMRIRIRLSR